MSIDRRAVLRGMGRTAAACVFGASLATAATVRPASGGPTDATAARRRRPAPDGLTDAIERWAAIRPAVVPRAVWRTDDVRTRHHPHPCATAVRAVFVHHTDTGNHYTRQEVPEMIQSFYDDHIEGNDWDDIGYNFLVDRMGTVYEGRAGGIDNAVIGAHTAGFNVGTVGIAAIGSFGAGERVPEPLLESVARIAAWKLGLYGVDARGRTTLTSTSDEARVGKGERAVFHTIAGHRDGYSTTCPGDALYDLLPAVRRRASRLQASVAAPGAPGRPLPGLYVPRVPA
jgi:hypothetical protein